MTFRDGATRTVLYTHFRLPMAQRRHIGFASSHFTRRALQVLHPVRTLDVLSRVFFSTTSGSVVIMDGAATKSSLVLRSAKVQKEERYGTALFVNIWSIRQHRRYWSS